MDRDNIASTNNIAPRLSFAFAPIRDGRTVIRGGIGLFYDQINLNVATYPQLQERLITRYGADGRQVVGTSASTAGAAKRRVSDATQRKLEYRDRSRVVKNLFVRVGYKQRQGYARIHSRPDRLSQLPAVSCRLATAADRVTASLRSRRATRFASMMNSTLLTCAPKRLAI